MSIVCLGKEGKVKFSVVVHRTKGTLFIFIQIFEVHLTLYHIVVEDKC